MAYDRMALIRKLYSQYPKWKADAILRKMGKRASSFTLKGYHFAGYYTNVDCHQYEGEGNSWSARANMTYGGRDIGAFCVNSDVWPPGLFKAYAVSGRNRLTRCEEYNGGTNIWTAKVNLSSGRYGTCGIGITTKGYLFGGYNSSVGYLRNNEELNPSANTWTSKTEMPSPGREWNPASFTVSNFGFVAGGFNGGSSPYGILDCDRYSQSGNSWSSRTNMPEPKRANIGGTAVNNKGLIFGGYNGLYRTDCDEYDNDTNVWTSKTSINQVICNSVGVTLEGYAYTFGGSNGNHTNFNKQFNPTGNSWENKTNMLVSRSGHGGGSAA